MSQQDNFDTQMKWMIYGANGYTGELIARDAVKRGLKPVLAGRSRDKVEALARELGLEARVFGLEDEVRLLAQIKGHGLVLHCAGPFSATAAPMMEACLRANAHYLDITGEIAVFEHAQSLNERARAAGVVICPGVGFDVVPTDCVAAALKNAMPDATHLALGFDSRSSFSPGTAKTSIEGMAQGGKVRRDGKITSVPLAYRVRRIDFGAGEKLAMTIPWGDVSTAWHTTGIANIEVFIPGSAGMIRGARFANWIRPLLGLSFVQRLLKARIGKTVVGPDQEKRADQCTYVWGEARNARGECKTARLHTANVYSLTIDAALAVVDYLLQMRPTGGAYTPALLLGAELVTQLPGSGAMNID
ncbi:saccharopine dehydrogenase family protein [Pseudomonas fluorescens]|uniref:saccharopine dehydrogenase family protein n=1 Tax=Pseudomonas fluorescens TaxID=294 RepID=UPI001A9DF73A|nr:saccharopine dehydrogenase NADP-binding domain-containing protein [Pseudomonas fluorescens]QTD31706.1 saccharopine dehydrogenase NADP-binding domain-containing protein [Pseudomonas fluorescens]